MNRQSREFTRTVWLVLAAALMATVSAQAGEQPSFRFADVAGATGADFQHRSPPTEQRHVHLTMGSGVGWLDYDRDGWPDLYCGQGGAWTGTFEPQDARVSDVLFRNCQGRFADVSMPAQIINAAYTMGLAAGDFDNDGFADLYVSAFGRNSLYRNNGDGTFEEITEKAGVDDRRFGSSCTWADIDGDGDLDLIVVNYLKIDPADYPLCPRDVEGRQVYFACHPRFLPAERDAVFRNEGTGAFTDVTAEVGFDSDEARQGLGVVAADLDGDNDVDLYIANDSEPNQLWVNDGTGHFAEEGFLSGLAVNLRGEREAGMGLAVGDADGDGRLDVFVTNYFSETNTFYRNEGQLMFLDVTEEIGLAAPSRLRLAFGASLIDVDNNGWLDLFVANGHVNDQMHLLGRTEEPFAQLPQLFANRGNGQFVDVSRDAGPYFQRPVVGRSSSVADFDRDGRGDLAVGHLNQPLSLLRNETSSTGAALMLELIGTSCNRDALAARIEVECGTRRELCVRMGSSSYLGCDEGRLLIGLAEAQSADRVVVHWPGRRAEVWRDLAVGSVHRLVEGTGQPDE